jgi:protein phosphatase
LISRSPKVKDFAVSNSAPQQAYRDSQVGATVSPAAPPTVHSFGLTDRGNHRPSNEDHFLIGELARTLWVHQSSLPQPPTHFGFNRGHIFLVADGMGGHQAGEVASALSVTTIENFVLHLLRRFTNLRATDEQTVLKDFQSALRQADARIFEEAAHHPEFSGMGTTLTMAFVSGWTLFVVHAGDSRCYEFRDRQLQQMTADHTVAAELARRGHIKPEEVRHHQFRHIVTKVLGGPDAGVDAQVVRTDLQPGDRILLCSDGLTEMLNDQQIAAILSAQSDPRAACERLVAAANEQGGRDNITAIVARFDV